MAISQSQIHQAADAIVERGESPTLAAVRKELGERYGGGGGSYTTISEALKVWRSNQRKREEVRELIMPDSVRDTIEAAGRNIYKATREAAQADVEALKTALEAREQETTRERSEALAVADELSKELDQTRGEIERLQAALALARSQATEATTLAKERQDRIAALNSDLEAAGKRVQDASGAAKRLEGELSEVRQELGQKETALTKTREEVENAARRAERLEAELTASKKENDALRAQEKLLRADLGQARDRIGKMEAILAQSTTDSARLQSENAKLSERSANTEQRAGELLKQVEDLQTKLAALAEDRGITNRR